MRKKLDTRFPAARIKKIMQADEDVGKIALAVPVLVSKALELFLQDLCDRTYEITLQRGAKTLNSVHLKHCVHTFSVFDFLKDVVSKVPDYSSHGYSGDPAAAAAVEMSRRRKASEEYGNESDEESKRSRMLTFNQQQQQVPSPRGRGRGGRGRGRGRGRSRGSGAADRGDMMIINPHHPETEQFGLPAISLQLPNPSSSAHPDLTTTTTTNNNNNVPESREPPLVPTQESNYATDDGGASTAAAGLGVGQDVILNTESIETQSNAAASAAAISVRTASAVGDQKDGECAADWPLSEVDHMAIDHLQLAHHLTHQMGEDEEDYDDEEEEKD